MSNNEKIIQYFGIIICIIGSFLPWQREGDFISYWINGIQVKPILKDNGGLTIVILSLFSLFLITYGNRYISNPINLIILINVLTISVVVFHICKIFIGHVIANGSIGAPTIQLGLVMIILGSIIQLFNSINRLLFRN